MSATISRRQALQAAGWAATALFTSSAAAQQQGRITVEDIMGPYYPIQRPLDEDADLTRVDGQPGVAQGTRIDLRGRVVDTLGLPVAGAWIEMWQANTHGRYAHATDPNVDAPLDPAFQGFGRQETDEEGRFRFLTIVPGPYPVGTSLRTPHIHFDIRGQHDRLVTQIYFSGEPLNDSDLLYQALSPEDRETVTLTPRNVGDDAPLEAEWTVVLATG
ncbi:protocatechuate 3,4-dioxygenase [Stenotrophomonas sp. SORGH_AS_0321]|uniref:protocatechuate 3,4-dioxygenase n=1 Tax=Stenotrophomonas sp. SORGH_AS_0321 TaxID=3041787 RepID=UPI00286340EC|nr:protocatechuate 3,4-dioxygenase [Stenotrophomonas sp. SORGH_AS_0321]MDR6093849.1 protocatechuate 3,4-dioxygenase beta subunit [Stenotrophomonas sp. SORGH_AS_0321]